MCIYIILVCMRACVLIYYICVDYISNDGDDLLIMCSSIAEVLGCLIVNSKKKINNNISVFLCLL